MFYNCGKQIVSLSKIIMAVAFMAFVIVIIVEASNPDVWDFGSLQEILLLECGVLAGGYVFSLLVHGLGEMLIRLQELRDLIEEM